MAMHSFAGTKCHLQFGEQKGGGPLLLTQSATSDQVNKRKYAEELCC